MLGRPPQNPTQTNIANENTMHSLFVLRKEIHSMGKKINLWRALRKIFANEINDLAIPSAGILAIILFVLFLSAGGN
jgi:hypothetical protein